MHFTITTTCMQKFLLQALILISSTTSLSAQDLYILRDMKNVHEKKQGRWMVNRKNYWQNSANYNITHSFTSQSHDKGSETITYFNNSPDTLANPAIKFFLNVHKPGARDQGASAEYLTSGVKVNSVKVNGASFPWKENQNAWTVQSLRLPKPLIPHDSVKIEFDWQFDISVESNRRG